MSNDRQEATGSNITQAGRDVNISYIDKETLRTRFSARIQSIDESINKRLPKGGLHSPTAAENMQPFSAEKLILSLAKSGIPIPVGIQVAETLEEHLGKGGDEDEAITTTHVRREVLRALYSMTDIHSASTVEHWADIYARRFGNPEERLTVLHRDGNEEDLNFSFLLEMLIPHLVSKVVKVKYAQLRDGDIISMSTARKMADEILNHVKGLNVYSIRYKTLFNLAYDIAVQPPHPWFVNADTREKTVEYDLERASFHIARLRSALTEEEHGARRHSAIEIIHHSCSAILAHYGAFLGVTQLGPLAQLIHALKLRDAPGNAILWEFSDIRRIEGDLIAIGESREGLLQELVQLRHNHSVPEGKLHVLARHAERIYSVAHLLIDAGVRVSAELKALIGSQLVDRQRLLGAAVDVLARVEGVHLRPEEHPALRWLVLNFQSTALRAVQPRVVIVAAVSAERSMNWDDIDAAVTLLKAEIDREPLCNTGILITDQPLSDECRLKFRGRSTKTEYMFSLCVEDLGRIIAASHRIQVLTDVLVNQ